MTHNARSTRATPAEVFHFYPYDGIIDLFIGFGLLLAGLFIWAEMFWLVGIYPAIFFPVWQSAKKQITAPRLSRVRVDPRQRQRLVIAGLLWLGILVILTLAGLAVLWVFKENVLATTWWAWLGQNLPLVLGMGGAVTMGMTALIGHVPHWLINALAIALLTVIGFWQGWAGWLVFVLSGGTFLLTGGVLLAQFLHQYPLPAART